MKKSCCSLGESTNLVMGVIANDGEKGNEQRFGSTTLSGDFQQAICVRLLFAESLDEKISGYICHL